MKKMMSGSLDKDSKYSQDDLEKESVELLKKIFESDLFDQVVNEELSRTFYTLKKPKDGFTRHWFFNFETKKLESYHRDTTVEIIEDYDEDSYLCCSNSSTFIVPKVNINSILEN